jgi:hypothetical protein
MKRIALLALILALILALALALAGHHPRRTAGPETGHRPPLDVAVSTPETPLPPPEETVLDVSTELSPLPLRVCAGDAVRWRNRDPGPVILTASDASFSSGVLGPGEEYAVVFPAAGVVSVTVLSPAGETVMEPYRIEVVRCEGELP